MLGAVVLVQVDEGAHNQRVHAHVVHVQEELGDQERSARDHANRQPHVVEVRRHVHSQRERQHVVECVERYSVREEKESEHDAKRRDGRIRQEEHKRGHLVHHERVERVHADERERSRRRLEEVLTVHHGEHIGVSVQVLDRPVQTPEAAATQRAQALGRLAGVLVGSHAARHELQAHAHQRHRRNEQRAEHQRAQVVEQRARVRAH